MTHEQFRNNPEMRDRLAQMLNDPVMMQALILVERGEQGICDVADLGAPEIASVRLLSQQAGRSGLLGDLQLLAAPIVEIKPLGDPTYEAQGPEGAD